MYVYIIYIYPTYISYRVFFFLIFFLIHSQQDTGDEVTEGLKKKNKQKEGDKRRKMNLKKKTKEEIKY